MILILADVRLHDTRQHALQELNAYKAEHTTHSMHVSSRHAQIQCMVCTCPLCDNDAEMGMSQMSLLQPAVPQMYETAAPFFELAAQVQPQEVKWHLMVASCFRRTGNQQQVTHQPSPMTTSFRFYSVWVMKLKLPFSFQTRLV